LFDVLVSCVFLLSAVLSWAWGYDGFVVVDLLCWAGHLIIGGGVRLGEYGKCIMHFGLDLELSKFLFLQLPVTVIQSSLSFSPSSGIPAHRQLSPDLFPLLAYLPNSFENLWHDLNATSSSLQIDLKQ
jgi:hypothetical protein